MPQLRVHLPSTHCTSAYGFVDCFNDSQRWQSTPRSSDGNTPLHLAAQAGLLDMAKHLVDLGADTTKENSSGVTPMGLARQYGRNEIADLMGEL